jgi:hypothetical protein
MVGPLKSPTHPNPTALALYRAVMASTPFQFRGLVETHFQYVVRFANQIANIFSAIGHNVTIRKAIIIVIKGADQFAPGTGMPMSTVDISIVMPLGAVVKCERAI